jgi:hypothetical protein
MPTRTDGRRRGLVSTLARDGWNARRVDGRTILASKPGERRLIRVAVGTSPTADQPDLDVFATTAEKIGAAPQIGWWPASRGTPQFLETEDWDR